MYRCLLLCWCGGLALTDRVLINRRARQKLPDRETGDSSARGEAGSGGVRGGNNRQINNLSVAGQSSLSSRASEVSVARDYGPRYYETSSRAPRAQRRRSQTVGGGGRTQGAPQLSQPPPAPPSQRTVSRARSRARIPRRRVNPNRDLERNERNALSIQLEGLTEERFTTTASTVRSRSRSRSRSRFVSEGKSEVRGEVRGRGRTVTRKTDVSPRLSVTAPSSSRAKFEERATAKPAGPKVIFPRKNLFPKLNKKFFLGDNEVDTGGQPPYKSVNKERLRSSLSVSREEEEEEPLNYLDYSQTDLQSGLGEPTQSGHLITVTHQVPTRTIFTVVERGQTKSLFAEVLETSLQVGSDPSYQT